MANNLINDTLKYGARLRDFVNPSLMSNVPIGGNTFGVTGHADNSDQNANFWRIFKGYDGDPFLDMYNGYVLFYNPLPLNIFSIEFHSAKQPINISLYSSNDNFNFDLLANFSLGEYSYGILSVPMDKHGFKKYFKIINNSSWFSVYRAFITGKELVI